MITSPIDPAAEIALAVDAYRQGNDVEELLGRLDEIARASSVDALIVATEPFRDIPEVAGPIYETIVAREPENARALVVLANAYWLSGRGPEAVEQLATRAIASDPGQRGAWHLWALAESNPRARTERWRQVTERFPTDDLARATLADNATSLAGAEHDRDALALAIKTYRELLVTATHPEQRSALERAISTLESWKL
ncbi:MAG: hypothetical protein M3081_20635 [Gemmatimonadota bacterium]|nr:hypothetical protein [Gemmatimonadota bacterium]